MPLNWLRAPCSWMRHPPNGKEVTLSLGNSPEGLLNDPTTVRTAFDLPGSQNIGQRSSSLANNNMVVFLHSSSLSPNGQRVAVILIEKKIPFKLVGAQNIKSEEYLTIHPVCYCGLLALPPLMVFIVWPNAPHQGWGHDPLRVPRYCPLHRHQVFHFWYTPCPRCRRH